MRGKIFEGEKVYIFKLPDESELGWVVVPINLDEKHKWKRKGDSLSPSIVFKDWEDKIYRHFIVEGGRAKFCDNDKVCPEREFELEEFDFDKIDEKDFGYG